MAEKVGNATLKVVVELDEDSLNQAIQRIQDALEVIKFEIKAIESEPQLQIRNRMY